MNLFPGTLAPLAIRLGYHDARPWHMLPNVQSL